MIDLPVLLKYAEQFQGLHTSFTYAQNQSPHKFILLYSLCLLYASGSLRTEQIKFSDELLIEWQMVFRKQWQLWVANDYHQEKFGMPLYHMKTEPFWHFHIKPDMVAKTQAFYKKYYNYNLSRTNAERMLAGLPPVGR